MQKEKIGFLGGVGHFFKFKEIGAIRRKGKITSAVELLKYLIWIVIEFG